MMDTLDIVGNLKKLALNDKQIKIVTELLSSGTISISELAKRVGIARSSLYRYLEELEKEGWTEYSLSTQGKKVQLSDLSSLKTLIKEKRAQLGQQEDVLDNIIENINRTENDYESKPKVNYYEGQKGIRQIQWNATYNSTGQQRVLTSYITRDIVGSKWYEEIILQTVRKKHNIKIIVDKEYVKNFAKKYGSSTDYYEPYAKLYTNLNKRVYDETGFKIKGKVIIYDNIVAMMSQEGGKFVGSEIESQHIATTYKSLFDVIWKQTSADDQIDRYLAKIKKGSK